MSGKSAHCRRKASRDILLNRKSFYTTVFPARGYGITPMPSSRPQLIVCDVRSSKGPFAKGHRDSDQNSPLVWNDLRRDFVSWNCDNFNSA